ncbi:MAG: LysM peptidoglycan-binding domain-containing protein [Chloroflexi bacterium]|nr:LysM peptidoglycan-binding domain-containing protein [Chloroflexota bacterium]
MLHKNFLYRAALAAALLLAACTPAAATAPAPVTPGATAGRLPPYLSPTATITPLPPDPATATPLPLPSPTPRSHTVQAGEDMGGIAYQYGITVADLMAANPDADPHALSIGTVLVIPAAAPAEEGQEGAFSATPVAVNVGAVDCYPSAGGGAWCFVAVSNPGESSVESVTLSMQAAVEGSDPVFSQTAALLLDVLPSGATLPAAAYFSGLPSGALHGSAELLTSLPLADPTQRYLPAHLQDLRVEIQPGGLSARITATAALESSEGQAAQVWVAVTAYDAAGHIVAVRRWESSQPLGAGESLPVSLELYSLGAGIQRVEAQVEARP